MTGTEPASRAWSDDGVIHSGARTLDGIGQELDVGLLVLGGLSHIVVQRSAKASVLEVGEGVVL